MNLLNLFFILETSVDEMCGSLSPVLTLVGYVVWAIKVGVPVLLIITGMWTMAQAVMKDKEEEIKKAQSLLIKKLIAAVIVYLIISIVGAVFTLVNNKNVDVQNGYESCTTCIFAPFSSGCGVFQ